MQTLDDDLFVARTGWRPFKASVPSGVAKKCVRTRTRHRVPSTPRVMHRSSRRRRPIRKRGTQAIRRVLFRIRNPTRPGGTPSGRAAAMGCPRSVRPPLEPRGSLPFNTKNERRTRKKKNKGEGKVKVKSVDRFVRLCVVIQSAVTSYIYMRRLDFPYKKMTQIPSKASNPVQTTRAGTSGRTGTSGIKIIK